MLMFEVFTNGDIKTGTKSVDTRKISVHINEAYTNIGEHLYCAKTFHTANIFLSDNTFHTADSFI